MSAAKRFYTDVGVLEAPDGWRVTLDGRPVQTPAGGSLSLASRKLAVAVADEWEAQDGEIRPHSMPLFRLCATAIDRVGPDRRAMVDGIVAYGPTDLLCYRAVEPPDLVERQEAVWSPLLAWAQEAFDVEFRVTAGVMPVEPVPDLQERLAGHIDRLDDFSLTALASATATCGSVILGLALTSGRLASEAAFEAAMLDELYQAGKWGEDEEAAERRRTVKHQIDAVAAFMALSGIRVPGYGDALGG